MNALTPIDSDNAVRLAGTVSESEAEIYFHALRGRLLNEFALAERGIDGAIARLIAAGMIDSNAQLANRMSGNRLAGLLTALKGDLANRRHVTAAVAQLDRWTEMRQIRHALAHGAMTIEADETAPGGWIARLDWYGSGDEPRSGPAAKWDMATFGSAIQTLTKQRRDLCSQLGQVGRRTQSSVVQG